LGGNYEKSIYNQLMEVMGRLDAVEKDLRVEKTQHKEDVERLNARISELTCENQLLRDDNERLKSILTMTVPTLLIRPLPIRRQAGRPILIMEGKRPGVRQAGRKATKALLLPKQTWKKSSGLENAGIRYGKSAVWQAGSISQSTR